MPISSLPVSLVSGCYCFSSNLTGRDFRRRLRQQLCFAICPPGITGPSGDWWSSLGLCRIEVDSELSFCSCRSVSCWLVGSSSIFLSNLALKIIARTKKTVSFQGDIQEGPVCHILLPSSGPDLPFLFGLYLLPLLCQLRASYICASKPN